jgi:hypothetical protein
MSEAEPETPMAHQFGIISYDLLQRAKSGGPLYSPLRQFPPSLLDYADVARRKAERFAAISAALALAVQDWDAVASRHLGASGAVAAAVLMLHHPEANEWAGRVGCRECREADGCDGTEPVEWPCPTYAAIKEATG